MKKLLFILSCLFFSLSLQAQTLHKVQKGNLFGYANKAGEIVIPCKYAKAYNDTTSNLAFLYDDSVKQIVCFNSKGKFLFYTYMFKNAPDPVEEGTFRILNEEGKMGFADEKGRIFIPPVFDFAYAFKNTLARVTFQGEKFMLNGHEVWRSNHWFSVHRSYSSTDTEIEDILIEKEMEGLTAKELLERGEKYFEGDGVKSNWHTAVLFYRKAAAMGYVEAQYRLAYCIDHNQGNVMDPEEKMKWYRAAADQGHAESQYQVGRDFFYGILMEKNTDEALEWFRKAAKQHHGEAEYFLGWCYDEGKGVAKDSIEAAKWYLKGAQDGNAEAQNSIAFKYYWGVGVPKDYKEAAKWFMKAAQQGHIEAQFGIGYCYRMGKGIEKDSIKAFEWFDKYSKSKAHSRIKYIN